MAETTKTSVANKESVLHEKINEHWTLVYMVDRDQNKLMKEFNDIKFQKQIISAYGHNNRHYLVIYVDARVLIKNQGENK